MRSHGQWTDSRERPCKWYQCLDQTASGDGLSHARSQIREIRSRGRLPIIVGGTHYYTQSLLFQEPPIAAPTTIGKPGDNKLSRQEISARYPILNASTEEIWTRLKEEDPVMAQRWHPNDRRRIQRSLEIFLLTGKRASDTYDEQRRAAAPPKMTLPELESKPSLTSVTETLNVSTEAPAGRTLRFPTLILWAYAAADVLKPRLEERVHAMLRGGLLSEVELLDRQRRDEQGRGISTDTTRGIWVSIGYKEFLPFLTALNSGQVSAVELESIEEKAIRRTQTATWQYAKRQIRWIRIKLLHAVSDAGAKQQIFVLGGDGESADGFSSVIATGADLVHRFLGGAQLPAAAPVSPLGAELLVPKQDDMSRNPELWVRKRCEVCETVTVTEQDWAQHVRSRGHRRATKLKKERPQHRFGWSAGEPLDDPPI